MITNTEAANPLAELNLDAAAIIPLTLDAVIEYFKTEIHLDATDIARHKVVYKTFRLSEAQILAELGKWKKDQLVRLAGFSGRDEKKAQMIKSAWRSLLQSFSLSNTFTWSFGGPSFEVVIDGMVEKLTDQDLTNWRAARVAARQEREETRADVDRATTNPETLDDFAIAIRRRGIAKLKADETPVPRKSQEVEALIRRIGMKELTDDELERYDELVAAEAAQKRGEKMVEKATIRRIEIGEGNYMEIVKWWHSKRECDTWLVVLAEYEDRTTFEELCIAARKLGGNYSRAWEARPGGFQFFDEAQAEKFVMLQSKDIFEMSRLERLIRYREMIRDNAIGHFDTLADRMEDRATDKLAEISGRNLNTERRIMIAENSTDQAHATLSMADTLRSYAEALRARLTRHTDRIRWRTHAEAFDEILAGANGEVRLVEYPWPTVGYHVLLKLADDIGTKDGSIMVTRRIRKLVDECKGTSHNIRFGSEYHADLLRHFYRRARMHRSTRWALDSIRYALGNYKRLRLMNIDTLPELRAALREHKGRRVQSEALTRAQKVMLDLYPGQFPPDYFPTPIDVVELMLEYADVTDGMTLLEPSAGSGHIANVLRERFPRSPLVLTEISGMLCRALEAQGYKPVQGDFLQVWKGDTTFDRIIMNPPFGCDGVGTDIDHVRHAYTLLASAGRLVSVMSEGVFYRGDGKAQEFRAWLESVGGMDFELPEGAFLNSDRPTSWASRIVVIDKQFAANVTDLAADDVDNI